MTSVVVPAQTGELGRRWLTATVAAAGVAAAIPIVAGGPGTLLRVAMAVVTIAGFTLAARHRRTLEVPVVVALLSVLTVADTARVDRAVVALPTAIAVLLAIECAVVTRRLDTAAPVAATGHDVRAVATTVAASALAGAAVAGLAQLATFGWRAMAAGATVALAAVALAVRGGLEDTDNGTG
jgi:hypothetical protein